MVIKKFTGRDRQVEVAGGGALGNFENNRLTKKSWKGNRASAFYYPGHVFELLQKLLHCPPKNIMHNLKVRKNFMPKKITQPPSKK